MAAALSERLSHAITLCKSLREALVDINAFPTSVQDRTSSRLHGLRVSLSFHMSALAEPRNMALAAVQRFPRELIREVFSYIGDPVGVSHVCRRWREVALDMSALWTEVGFRPLAPVMDISTSEWHPWFGNAGKNRTFRLRAKSALLRTTVRIDSGSLSQARRKAFIDEAQGLVEDMTLDRTHSAQWPDPLEPDVPSPSFLDCILNVRTTLRRLTIKWSYNRAPDVLAQSRFTSFLSLSFPALDELHLMRCPTPEEHSTTFTALSSLRNLNVEGASFVQTYVLLQCCPNLRDLVMLDGKRYLHEFAPQLNSAAFVASIKDARIPLVFLQNLTVGFPGSTPWGLCLLSAPNLNTLDIGIQYRRGQQPDPHTDFLPTVTDFLDDSSNTPFLHTLKLDSLNRNEIMGILGHQSVQRIVRLTIKVEHCFNSVYREPEGSYDYDAIIRAVGSSRSEIEPHTMLCPQLKHLFYAFQASPSCLSALCTFTRYRNLHGCPMDTIRLSGWGYPLEGFDRLFLSEEVTWTAAEAYEAEKRLAHEVQDLVIGEWRFEPQTERWTSFAPTGFMRRRRSFDWY